MLPAPDPTIGPIEHGMSPGDALLTVDRLSVSFPAGSSPVVAVNDVSLVVRASEFVGLVGESGSGKSVTAAAILGLLSERAEWSGVIRFAGVDLTNLSREGLRALRGAELAMVSQNPMSGLNPMLTIGRQMADTISAHQSVTARSARARSTDLLDLVGLPQPRRALDAYPHELSGGMQQRVMIAMAITHQPRLIIADEPTTALDVTIQAQIMDVLQHVRSTTGAAVLLITHNLGLVAGGADRVYVMYGGEILESGPTEAIFYGARSPYTRALLGAQPGLGAAGARLVPIGGSPHGPMVGGCVFRDRCLDAADGCERHPDLVTVGEGHAARCVRVDEVSMPRPPPVGVDRSPEGAGPPVLEARKLEVRFRVTRNLRRHEIVAVDGVDLALAAGETLSVVGESGSGKTTLGRALARLIEPTAGEVWLAGRRITRVRGAALRSLRSTLQIVFQDPYGSLDPLMSAEQSIAEPLVIAGIPRSELRPRVVDLALQVGLSPGLLGRRPAQLSGGQLQRIGLARALAVAARVIVLDEPVSALDLSIQAEILNLLADLQDEHDLSYLFITHDLSVCRHLSDRVAVMYLGQVVEIGDTGALFAAPAHPYTQALQSAAPLADPRRERTRARIVLEGERPDPARPPSGCRFHTRCPMAQPRCAEEEPVMRRLGMERRVACHFPLLQLAPKNR
jgi:peptide/nickel transport system ATP-binding protein